ncbi:Pyruvate/2-oxoglutarate dehydrogenase complex, dihydrolipoamide acyltransferase (E2) component, and related enzymes [Variovorax sp. HW608]|nr:Pyruvate/2-oxoglutarate dehydrogenase complex, dihydrolipoamide acyltransferase (E2) component, and related enzymes [Variovorax sp. HW608]
MIYMTDIVLDGLLSEAIEAGDQALLTSWHVSEGDHVRMGQPLAQVCVLGESIDIAAPHAGMVEEIVIPAGEKFAAGDTLARLIEF